MAVVSREELAAYCRLDEEALIDEAMRLAEVMASRLNRKGAADTKVTHADYCMAVKAMTLHELDHPGEPLPQGIQTIINELKLVRHGGASGEG